jgi:hypothetical protein
VVEERRERLPAAGVEHRQRKASRPFGVDRDATRQRRQRSDRGESDTTSLSQRPRRRDPDPKSSEGARADADRDPLDPSPAARGFDTALDLGEEHLGVARAPVRARTDGCLADDLPVIRHAHHGVGGCGVDTEDEHQ